MPVQKQRHSKARQARGRVGLALKRKSTQTCPKCGSAKLAHQVCKKCGYYKGKEVINTLKKAKKKK
jgi:large subunit ribosomal protein L32